MSAEIKTFPISTAYILDFGREPKRFAGIDGFLETLGASGARPSLNLTTLILHFICTITKPSFHPSPGSHTSAPTLSFLPFTAWHQRLSLHSRLPTTFI